MAERQVGESLSQIRPDHVARYDLAAEIAGPADLVLDAACGCGYGAHLIAEASRCENVTAIDLASEAIAYAEQHWSHPRVSYAQADVTAIGAVPYTLVVSFETIEHLPLEVAARALQRFRRAAPRLLVSVPNEDAQPFDPARFEFHFRHYTVDQLCCLLAGAGWRPVKWWTQYDKLKRAVVSDRQDGGTLIALCEGV